MGLPLASTKASVSVRDSQRIVKTARTAAEKKLRLELKSAEIQANFAQRVIRLINSALNKHRVTKALRGQNQGAEDGSDLLAEFGLYPEWAEAGLDAVKEATNDPENVKLSQPKVSRTSAATQIQMSARWYDESVSVRIASDPRGQYPSKRANIPWLLWSLDFGGNVVSQWDIIYDLPANAIQASRSEDALMIGPSRADWTGPYFVPDFVKPTRGSDWVHEAVSSIEPLAAKELEKALRQRLQLKFPKRLR